MAGPPPGPAATESGPTLGSGRAATFHWESNPEVLVGRTVGKFRVEKVLGRGGMGVVYQAVDPYLERACALKLLPPGMTRNGEGLDRFLREARAAARLQHPNAVGVYEVLEADGTYCLAMELVRGASAADVVRKQGAFGWRQTVRIAADVCKALQAAHDAGLIHRDIKPANIMQSDAGPDGRPVVKLADFGLAKVMDPDAVGLTGSGQVLGTPQYMSPEQCFGRPADARSDLYSLGATMYALLTGKPPFPGTDPMTVMFAHCHGERPDVRKTLAAEPPRRRQGADDSPMPDAVAAIILRAMAKDPDERYASASAMQAELEACLTLGSPGSSGNSNEDVWSDLVRVAATMRPGATGARTGAVRPVTPASNAGGTGRAGKAGLPPWVVPASAGAAALVVLVVVIVMLTGGKSPSGKTPVRPPGADDMALKPDRPHDDDPPDSVPHDPPVIPPPADSGVVTPPPVGRKTGGGLDPVPPLPLPKNKKALPPPVDPLPGTKPDTPNPPVGKNRPPAEDPADLRRVALRDAGRFMVQGGTIWDTAWSPEENSLVFACNDGRLRIIGGPPGNLDRVVEVGPNPLRCLAYSDDGTRLAVGSFTGRLYVYEWPSMRQLANWAAHGDGRPDWIVNGVAWAPGSNRRLASVGWTDRAVKVWTLNADNQPEAGHEDSHEGGASSVAWHPTNGTLVSGGARGRMLARTIGPDGRMVGEARNVTVASDGNVERLAFTADGTRMSAILGDGRIEVFDTATWEDVRTLTVNGYAFAGGITTGGRWLVVGIANPFRTNDAGRAVAFDLRGTGREELTLHGGVSGASAIPLTRDGRRVAVINFNGAVHIYEVNR